MANGRKSAPDGLPQKKCFKLTPYILMLPSIALFTMFTFWPFLKTIILSFSYTDKKGNFVGRAGVSNYLRVVSSSLFSKTMSNTFLFALIVGIGTLLAAIILALLSASREKGSRLYEVMFALPMAVASAPAASIFTFALRKEGGIINAILGTDIAWLQDPNWALVAVAFVTIWLSIGSSYIFLLVGFRNVSEDLLESARLDGAGPIRRALSILIPVASPQIFFVVFLNIANSFKAFGQIKLLTDGGPNNATTTLIFSMCAGNFPVPDHLHCYADPEYLGRSDGVLLMSRINGHTKKFVKHWSGYALKVLLGLLIISPIIVCICYALKSQQELMGSQGSAGVLPKNPHWKISFGSCIRSQSVHIFGVHCRSAAS